MAELKTGRFSVELVLANGKTVSALTRAINGHTFDLVEQAVKELEEERMGLLAEAPSLKQALVSEDSGKTSLSQIQELSAKAPELNSKARRLKVKTTLVIGRLMIDTDVQSAAAYKDEAESGIDSDFWKSQDLTALGEAVKRFRGLLFGSE